MVSSTTPRLGPIWPPFLAVTAMSSSRISCANSGSCEGVRALTSAGPRIASRRRGSGGGEESFIGGSGRRSALAGRFELGEADAFLRFFELLDLELGFLQPGLADLEELVAVLIPGQQLGQ